MCMIDDADADTQFSHTIERRARKSHACSECGRMIRVGEIYRYAAGKAYDEMWDAKQCAHCRVAAEWLRENCRGFLYHAVIEDFAEHATGRMDMLRVVVGARRKWRSFVGGGLLPLPVYPRDMKGNYIVDTLRQPDIVSERAAPASAIPDPGLDEV